MSPLAWAILLLFLGLGIVFVEVFVPSGGILGVLALASLLSSVVLAFRHDTSAGVSFLALAVIGLPAALALAFRFWPHTPIGRRLLLQPPSSEEVLPDDTAHGGLRELIGQVGRAKCLMLPGGVVSIQGRTVDAVSEGIPIEAGQTVKVVEVRGRRVVVRPTGEPERPAAEASDDPLSRPIDTLGLDPFDDPLA